MTRLTTLTALAIVISFWAFVPPVYAPERKIVRIDQAAKMKLQQNRELKRRITDAALLSRGREDKYEWRTAFVGYETKTFLEVGIFHGDLQNSKGSKMSFEQPGTFTFRWSTAEPEAFRSKWELMEYPSMKVLANGWNSGKRGLFDIRMEKYVSPTPPPRDNPQIYLVQVTPYPVILDPKMQSSEDEVPERLPLKSKSGIKPRPGMKVRPDLKREKLSGVEEADKDKAVLKKDEPAGLPSAPVVLLHHDLPDVQFEVYDLFRRLDVYLESIQLYNDSSEVGDEEFWISGWALEEPTRVQEQVRVMSIEIPEHYGDCWKDKSECKDFPLRPNREPVTFHLGTLDDGTWPRVYTVGIAVMEEDCGNGINPWLKKTWKVARDNLQNSIHGLLDDDLEKGAIDFLEGVLAPSKDIAEMAKDIGDKLSGWVSGGIVDIMESIVFQIISDLDDDDYGTEIYQLSLPTNDLNWIVANMKGELDKSDPENWHYIIKQKQKLACPCPNCASGYDGSVIINIRWELSDMEPFMGGLSWK